MLLALALLPAAAIVDLDFSRDGKQIAVAREDGSVQIWDADSLTVKREHKFPKSLTVLAFSSSSDAVAVGGKDGYAAYLDFKQPAKIWEPKVTDRWDVTGIAFSPDGKKLGWSTLAESVIFNLSERKQLNRLTIRGNGIFGLAIHQDGKTVTTGGQYLSVWDLSQSDKENVEESPSPKGAKSLNPLVSGWTNVFSPTRTGDQILAASVASPGDGGKPRTLILVDPKTQKILKALVRSGPVLRDVAVGPDGSFAASLDEEGTVTAWQVATALAVMTHKVEGATCIAAAPNSQKVAIGKSDGTFEIWGP